MRTRLVGALTALFIVALGTASGQQKGQYILGTNGLNAGVQPAPGFSYGNQGTFYWADRLKGPDGNAVPTTGSYELRLDQNFFIYTSKSRLFGGNIGGTFDLIIANGSVTAPQIGVQSGGAGISDVFVIPIQLGYHFSRVDFTVGFGVMMPTGRFNANPNLNPNLTSNTGSGYWGYLPVAGGTVYLTKNKNTTLSVFSAYEFHGKKRNTNITPGQTFNFEWGLGQMIPVRKNFFQVGAVGYGQWQTTMDGGSVPQVIKDSRYGVAAIGPQISFVVPKWDLNLFARWEPEFGASARPEGSTFTFGGAMSFPVTK